MARNSEKRFTKLNRFLQAKEKEIREERQRPALHTLHTAVDVKEWIPSIQREIEYLLQQIQGTGSRRYTDPKIQEFKMRIEELEQEHKRFVAKVRLLDPSYRDVMPWQPRAYTRKRRHRQQGGGGMERKGEIVTNTKRLCSPLIQTGEAVIECSSLLDVATETPSSLSTHTLTGSTGSTGCSVHVEPHSAVRQTPCLPHTSLPMASLSYHTAPQPRVKSGSPRVTPQPGILAAPFSGYLVTSDSNTHSSASHDRVTATLPSLGLDYSSSEEEEKL